MINSRRLDDLLPPVKERVEAFLALAKAAGIDLLVTSTYRDSESQQALYAQGRTAPGPVVTSAMPGWSYHNWRCAVDVVPIRAGKCVWNDRDQVWQVVGRMGEQAGLEWAGNWIKFREYPHFQYTGGHDIVALQKGATVV